MPAREADPDPDDPLLSLKSSCSSQFLFRSRFPTLTCRKDAFRIAIFSSEAPSSISRFLAPIHIRNPVFLTPMRGPRDNISLGPDIPLQSHPFAARCARNVPEPLRFNPERSSCKGREYLQMVHVILTWQGINPDHEKSWGCGSRPAVS